MSIHHVPLSIMYDVEVLNGRRHPLHPNVHGMTASTTDVIGSVVSRLATTMPPTVNTTLVTTSTSTPYSVSAAAIIVIITSLMTVGCLFGNSLVILTVLLVHRLKTPSNYLIVSLAVSDWLVGFIVMPLSIAYEILGYWPLEKAACAIWVTFDVALCTASILNLMMISIDRYLVITRPMEYYSQQQRKTKVILSIAIAWLLSLLISVTPLFAHWWPEDRDSGNGHLCMVSQKIEYQIYATSVAFYLPLAVMLGLYGKIYLISWKVSRTDARNVPQQINTTPLNHQVEYKNGHVESKVALPHEDVALNNHSHDPPTEEEILNFHKQPLGTIKEQNSVELDTMLNEDDPPSNDRQESITSDSLPPKGSKKRSHPNSLRKFSVATLRTVKIYLTKHRKSVKNGQAIKTLGVIMGLFTVCWLPFFTLAVVAPFCGDSCHVPKWMWGALTWIGYANSCLNPLIYARFDREFRTSFREILKCRCQNITKALRKQDYKEQMPNQTVLIRV